MPRPSFRKAVRLPALPRTTVRPPSYGRHCQVVLRADTDTTAIPAEKRGSIEQPGICFVQCSFVFLPCFSPSAAGELRAPRSRTQLPSRWSILPRPLPRQPSDATRRVNSTRRRTHTHTHRGDVRISTHMGETHAYAHAWGRRTQRGRNEDQRGSLPVAILNK